ncbi:MAG TPA: ParB/RepB/Spo0J family partition protein [Bryobacteraceae bacterium]|nr:ParB/RepB/Spo0J family partition protein [Bryobacteraceae bacterium]
MNKEPDRNPRKVLGKGLSALLPGRNGSATPLVPKSAEAASVAEPIEPKAPFPEDFEEFHSIPLDSIQAGEEQPRDAFDLEKLEELSRSIKANGLLQPIIVYRDPKAKERYRIVAGERRWRAATMAGLKEIPALVRSVDRDRLLELSLIENIQREDLNPIEIAAAFHRLSNQLGLSHEQIAERTGKERSTVTNFLRLLKLGAVAQIELKSGRISMGHARALLNVQNESEQGQLVEQIIAKRLSVREVEALVKKLSERPESPQVIDNKADQEKLDPNIRAALQEMEMALGTRVKLIVKSPKAGRLEIEYYSKDDLDRIYSVIVRQ